MGGKVVVDQKKEENHKHMRSNRMTGDVLEEAQRAGYEEGSFLMKPAPASANVALE